MNEKVTPTPPSAERVIRRALVLAALACRGSIESEAEQPEAQAIVQDIIQWIDAASLGSEMEPQEVAILHAPLGTLNERQQIDSSWRAEGAAALAWALNRIPELPSYDEPSNLPEVIQALGLISREPAEALAHAELRNADELARFNRAIFALHWRLREFRLRPQAMDFEEFARTSWFGPLETEGIRFSGRDMAIGELALIQATREDVQTCLSIVQERHQAVNWLRGEAEIYSKTETNT